MYDLSNENIIHISKNGINYIQFRILLELGIKHAYSLKSEGLIFRETGFGGKILDKGYTKLCSEIGLNLENLTLPKQNHTDVVQCIEKVYSYDELDNIDGLITNKENIILATTNADCILYLLYDQKNKVIANVHSGWRGSYQRIIEKTIDKMIENYNTNPGDIIICICPSIRKCCFEVDKDVRDKFYDKFKFLENINNYITSKKENNKFFIDTVGINNNLLINKGIKKENIYDSNICSYCNKEQVHSYRGEGKDFNLATAIISL